MIAREEVEDIEEFVHLGVTVSKKGGGAENINKIKSK